MGQINNFNFNNLDLKISNSDYWDFFLSNDGGNNSICNLPEDGSCRVVYYDFNNQTIYGSDNGIYSLVTWTGATNSGYTMNTFGLTGMDNGRISYIPDGTPTNNALLTKLTGTTLNIPAGDNRLSLFPVISDYRSELTVEFDQYIGNYNRLRGGFYQGFYKLDGTTYEVLPTRFEKGWTAEFWLRRSVDNPTTVSIDHVETDGFFFYMGTRSENKYWNVFEGNNTGCASGCTSDSDCNEYVNGYCTIPKETEIILRDEKGFGIPLSPPQISVDLITNQFLIYGRAKDGRKDRVTGDTVSILYNYEEPEIFGRNCSRCGNNHDGLGAQTVCTYDRDSGGIFVETTATTRTNTTNPFLIYGRAQKNKNGCSCRGCNGPMDGLGNETVCSFSGVTSPELEIDYLKDVTDNAIGFRIREDGSIGYRLLTYTGSTCDPERVIDEEDEDGNLITIGYDVKEEYSKPNVVKLEEWAYVVLRFVTNKKIDCDLENSKPRTGRLDFFINGKLKFSVKEFDEVIGRRLNEHYLKQVAVPFNFSLGGGSLGLLGSQTFDGPDDSDRNLPIEKHFAGVFIGDLSKFRFNLCDMSFCSIERQYKQDLLNFGFDKANIIIEE